ncbi:DUF1152 domain-containing protein [Halobacteriales archaeon Cl-PHB]
METLEAAFDVDRALVYGVGGGGDVVSTIPTARLLERHGVEVLLGGIPWERAVVDPTPGPRPLPDIEAVDQVSEAVGLAGPTTRTPDGVRFAETEVAAHFDEPVALVDISDGVRGTIAGLSTACAELDVDLVVGVDAGGDALARGSEPGLRSPIADAVAVAALAELDVPAMLGVSGWGSDGELTGEELDAALDAVAARDGLLGAWGLTPAVADELEAVLEVVETEASRLPVEASRGGIGERSIRSGQRSLTLTAASTVTFYLDPAAVAAASDLASLVRDSESVEAAHEALQAAGYATEIGYERSVGEN